MPTSSTKSPIAKTDVSRNSCKAWTSPCRRHIKRPTSVLSMNGSETRWKLPYIARRRFDQQPLRDACDQRLLDQVGKEVEGDDPKEDQHAEREQPLVIRALDQRFVDHGAQDKGDRGSGLRRMRGRRARPELIAGGTG
jgi:hypothetical protein